MPPYLGVCWWFCQTLASRHRPADKTHTQKRGMRHSKPLPSMRLYCEALEKQRGAADGGPSGEGYRERERRTERKRIWWRREKGAEIKEEKVMAVNTWSASASANNSLCSYVSQLVWLQDPDVTLDIKWQIKRLPKLSVVQNKSSSGTSKAIASLKCLIYFHIHFWWWRKL